MSKINVWCVTANHGYYGNSILCARMATDKEDASIDCLDEVMSHTQQEEKEWLRRNYENIISTLMKKSEYEQSEEGLRMVAELHELEVEMAFLGKVKPKNKRQKQ